MRLFLKVAAGLALAALLALLLFLSVSLVSPQAAASWHLGLSRGWKAAAFAISLALLFLVVFFSPSFARSFPAQKEERLPQGQVSRDAEGDGGGRERAAPSDDFVAQAVSRAAEQAVVSLVPEAARASAGAAGHSGRYVCRISGGFEGLMPKEGEGAGAAGLDPIASRDGIFVIDAEAASFMEGNADVDSDFKSLVDSVLT